MRREQNLALEAGGMREGDWRREEWGVAPCLEALVLTETVKVRAVAAAAAGVGAVYVADICMLHARQEGLGAAERARGMGAAGA